MNILEVENILAIENLLEPRPAKRTVISVWEFFGAIEDFVPIRVCESEEEANAVVAERKAGDPHRPAAMIVESEEAFMKRVREIGRPEYVSQ